MNNDNSSSSLKWIILFIIVVIVIILLVGVYLLFQGISEPSDLENLDVIENKNSTYSSYVLIEERIESLSFMGKTINNHCGDIVDLISSDCETHLAYYKLSGLKYIDNPHVAISVHQGLQEDAVNVIVRLFSKENLNPIQLKGNKVYFVSTYFGSYYYWLSDENEILVGGNTINCTNEFLDQLGYEDKNLADELKMLCSAMEQITIRYLDKYPSTL